MRRGRVALAVVVAVQVGAAAVAAQIIGVTADQRLVSIAADGAATTLFSGNALEGKQIVWSPDDSFAYVLSYAETGLLVFDGTEITGEIPIAYPEHVTFHPTRPLALVQGASYSLRAPLYVVDTRSHSIVGELSVPRAWDPWVITVDGRWAVGGGIVDLERIEPAGLREASFCDGSSDDYFAPSRAWRSDELIVRCSRHLVHLQASTGLTLGRVYFRSRVQGFGILPDGETALAVTPDGIFKVALPELVIVEQIPLPDVLRYWDDGDSAEFSDDGTVVGLGGYYFRTSDLSQIDVSLWWGGAPIAAELIGRVEGYSAAWRELDRSYYDAGDALLRFDVDRAEQSIVLADRRIFSALMPRSHELGYVVVAGTLEAQRVSRTGGAPGRPFHLFDVDAERRQQVQVFAAPQGDAILYGVEEADSFTLRALDFADGSPIGAAVVDRDSLDDIAFRPLSRHEAILFGRWDGRYAFIDLSTGMVTETGGGNDLYYERIVEAVADPIGPGVYLFLEAHPGADRADLPMIRYVAPGEEPRDVWRGRDHFRPGQLAIHPDGTEIYVTTYLSSGGPQRLALVDVASGATTGEISLPSWVRDVELSGDGRQLAVALAERPHLAIVDTASRAVLGVAAGAPAVEWLSYFSGGFEARSLEADALVPETPPSPDVVLFENWERIGGGGDRLAILSVAGSPLLTSLPLSREHDREVSLSAARGGRVVHVADWRLTPPAADDGGFLTIDLDSGAVEETPLDASLGWMIADPHGEVIYTVAAPDGGDRLVVSVVELANGEVVHSLAAVGKLPNRGLALSPDGTYLAISHDPLVLLDTRDSRLLTYDLSIESSPAIAAGHIYFAQGGDGRWLMRMPIEGGAPEPVARVGRDPHGATHLLAVPDGGFVLVAHLDYRFANVLVVGADGEVTELDGERPVLNLNGMALSPDGERLYLAGHSTIEGVEVGSGKPVARFAKYGGSDELVVGCSGDCPTPLPAPQRTPWRDRGTLAPTPVPTPGPGANGYEWFEIDPIAARPGELVEIRLRHRSTVEIERPIALRHELILPSVLEVAHWVDGSLDCEGRYDPWNRDYDLVFGRFEAREDPCPEQGGGCTRLSAIAASDWRQPSGRVVYRCRARVAEDAPLGTYEIGSENLVVESWDEDLEPFVVPGALSVVAAPQPPAPAPAHPAPRPRQQRFMTLSGSTPGGVPGEEIGVGFRLDPTDRLPGGELFVEVEVPDGLTLVFDERGIPRCGSNYAIYSERGFDLVPGECASGPCSILRVAMSLETGSRYYEWELASNWLQWFDLPVFECRYVIAPNVTAAQLRLPVRSATLAGEPLAGESGVVHVHLPERTFTPAPPATATPPPTATATPPSRSCEPVQAGRGIVCVDDLEADPGTPVELVIRFRSAGADYAGLEFEIYSAAATIVSKSGRDVGGAVATDVACRIDPAARKGGSAFARTSRGAVKALVLSLSDVDPIPDDIVLVRCTAETHADLAPGSYAIVLDEPGGSDPEGTELPLDVRPGVLTVPGAVAPTAPPTVTAAPRIESRPLDDRAGAAAGGSCHIDARPTVSPAPLLVLLLALLASARRPRRRAR